MIKTIKTIKTMASNPGSPFVIDDTDSRPSPAPSGSTLQNAFGLMMVPQPAPLAAVQRDRCFRPPLVYNHNYRPTEPPNPNQPQGYSPYVYGEPLFDDREVIIKNLPKNHTVAPATKKPRTSWTWKVGYALVNTSKKNNPTIWCCKLCMFN
jgi:hypothetical protein